MAKKGTTTPSSDGGDSNIGQIQGHENPHNLDLNKGPKIYIYRNMASTSQEKPELYIVVFLSLTYVPKH